MARKPRRSFDESELTKGQIRKLNALRKSLGQDIADKAFGDWLKTASAGKAGPEDNRAAVLVEALTPLFKSKKLKIPRGGYLITRWRDQVVVKPASPKK